MKKQNWKTNVAVFLASQAISMFGSSLVQFSITAYITLQTKSGVYAMVAILCAVLPTFIFSPFAGVLADKFNRKHLIIIADGSIAVCTLAVAVTFLLGYEQIWILFIALIFRAAGSAVQMPSVGAMLPDIVPEEHLTRMNGINGSMNSLFSLASPMLGAALMGIAPLGAIFFIDVITAIIGISVLAFAFRLPKAKKSAEDGAGKNYFHEMKIGLVYIKNTKYLTRFFAFCALFFFAMAPAAFLTQVQVVRNYGDEYWRLSTIEVTFGIGMLAGGLLITAWGGFKNRVHTIAFAAAAMGICTILLGIKSPYFLYATYMGLFGIAMPLMNTPAMTMLQERVAPQYLGRVFSVMTMINSSVMPLGMVLFGPLADIVDIEILLLVTGAVTIVMAFMMKESRALSEAGMPKEAAAERS